MGMEHGAHACLCVKSASSKLTGWKASKQHWHHLDFLTTEESLKRKKRDTMGRAELLKAKELLSL